MTTIDAIKGLKEISEWNFGKYEQTGEEDYRNDGEFLANVAELLKAQEPLKPIPDTSYGARPWWFVCGNCKLSVNEDQKYCPNCGRAVKWE